MNHPRGIDASELNTESDTDASSDCEVDDTASAQAELRMTECSVLLTSARSLRADMLRHIERLERSNACYKRAHRAVDSMHEGTQMVWLLCAVFVGVRIMKHVIYSIFAPVA
jgi:hypothetical protein